MFGRGGSSDGRVGGSSAVFGVGLDLILVTQADVLMGWGPFTG